MTRDIGKLYQEIAREAVSVATDINGKLLVYAEIEDGVVSADLFYEKRNERVVTFKFCSEHFRETILSLLEKWKAHPGNEEWRAMSYVVGDGKFSIDLTYPKQMKFNEELSDRKPRIIKKYFGQSKVDYLKPKP